MRVRSFANSGGSDLYPPRETGKGLQIFDLASPLLRADQKCQIISIDAIDVVVPIGQDHQRTASGRGIEVAVERIGVERMVPDDLRTDLDLGEYQCCQPRPAET